MNKDELINYKDHKTQLITYETWENRVTEYLGIDFKLIDVWYKKDYRDKMVCFLEIKHNCNESFIKNAYNIKHQKNCPICISKMQVSYLHAIICTLFEKYYNGVEMEKDLGFKGDNDGISRYDLYIDDYKGKPTVIEFQSRYHDGKEELDKRKKQHAIDLGCSFYEFDSRDGDILKVAKIFFPSLESIPDWAYENVGKFKKTDLSGVQELLNKYYTVEKVANALNISKNVIHHNVNNGNLTKPHDHAKIVYNKKSVIQLDLDGNFINEYETMYKVEKNLGIKIGQINLKGNVVYRRGYIWVYSSNYYNNNYSVKNLRIGDQKVYQLDLNEELINTYDSPKDVGVNLGYNTSDISSCCRGKRESYKNYIWMYEYYYNKKYKKQNKTSQN